MGIKTWVKIIVVTAVVVMALYTWLNRGRSSTPERATQRRRKQPSPTPLTPTPSTPDRAPKPAPLPSPKPASRAPAVPRMYRMEPGDPTPPAAERNTIGGAPVMSRDQDRPVCRKCDAPMVLFLQLDIDARFGLELQEGSHLLLFMCPTHNDIPTFCEDGQRVPQFWEKDTGAFALILNPPGVEEHVLEADRYLVARTLRLVEAPDEVEDDMGLEEAKVGGVPTRVNVQVAATCGCGAPMRYVLQLPENYAFPQQPDAPQQPDGFSSTEYGLFLGNIVHVLACSKQCDPQAVTVTLSN